MALISLQGLWTVSLYLGLLGVIWLPRYFVIPTTLRLWPSYWVNSNFGAAPSLSSVSHRDKKVYSPRNYTIQVDYKKSCFTCELNMKPKHCPTLIYSDSLFDSLHTSDSYDVYAYENYPCYQTVAKNGQCVLDDPSSVIFSGTGCTLCSLCHKNTIFNASNRSSSQYRKYSYTPRFTVSLGKTPPRQKHVFHCLNKLVLLRYYDRDQFCSELREHISVYKEGKTTVFTGCSSFCSDSSHVVHRELYSTELGLYLVMLAGVAMATLGVVSAVKYVLSLYRELGILNIAWNSNVSCPICMDRLYRFARVSTLRCGHMFCKGCLDQWLYVFCHVTCPLCRTPVDPNAPILATHDTFPDILQPGLLALSDRATPSDEEGSDYEETEAETRARALNTGLMHSIYNMGRNVVSGWSNSRPSSRSSRSVEELSGREDSTLPPTPRPRPSHAATLERLIDSVSVGTSTPIPMPYYPLTTNASVTSTNSIIAVWDSRSSLQGPCPSGSNSFLNNGDFPRNGDFPSNGGFRGQVYPGSFSGFNLLPPLDPELAHSDTELIMGDSPCRLQNRIARKLNRFRRLRGLAHYSRTRRTQSESDVTSMTSATSESEAESAS